MGKIAVVFVIAVALDCLCKAQNGQLFPRSGPYTCTTTCHPGIAPQPQDPVPSSSSRLLQGPAGKKGIPGSRGEKGRKGDPCQCDVADEEEIRGLREKMERLEAANQELKQSVALLQGAVQVAKSNITLLEEEDETLGQMNRELKSNISLLKRGNERLEATNLELKNNITLLRAIETNQWMVIQRRVDDSVDFYRNWESYARGFGDVDGNYWIGLRNLHMLTNARSYKLRIDLMNWENERRYAEYSTFRVADEESKFRLTVSGYTGDAGDAMDYHNGMLWSSFDRDSDETSGNCAEYHGAWWHKSCYHANLNGKYFPSSNYDHMGVRWNRWQHNSLKFVEMKIQPN